MAKKLQGGKSSRTTKKKTTEKASSGPTMRPKAKRGATANKGKSGLRNGAGAKSTRRDRQARRVSKGGAPVTLIEDVSQFLATYIIMPERSRIVVSTWIVASWLMEVWDRFPHLAVTSPEKRCGKTRLLQIIELLVCEPINSTNVSPASIYRLIEDRMPTLLLDEAQSLVRLVSESSHNIREIFCSGIDQDSKVLRCGGENNDVTEFSIYCAKVVALIGDLDGVLADRCIPIEMKRKTGGDSVERYRSRVVKPIGQELSKRIEQWAETNRLKVLACFDGDDLQPFDISNDRMAELLMPLQAVLTIAAPHHLNDLLFFANELVERERRAESMTDGIRLLTACKEIYEQVDNEFLPTTNLIRNLQKREEEPWSRLTPERLARLLSPYHIRPERNRKQTHRGYYCKDFKSSWDRYLPPTP